MCNCSRDEPKSSRESVTSTDNEITPQGSYDEQPRKKTCCQHKRSLPYENDKIISGTCHNNNVIPSSSPCRYNSPIRECDLTGVALVRRRIEAETSSHRHCKHERTKPSRIPKKCDSATSESWKARCSRDSLQDKPSALQDKSSTPKGKHSSEKERQASEKDRKASEKATEPTENHEVNPSGSESATKGSHPGSPRASDTDEIKQKKNGSVHKNEHHDSIPRTSKADDPAPASSTPCPGKLNPKSKCTC